jgi:hypothetical protein
VLKVGLIGKAKPKRVVVKECGRDSFLGLINPIMTLLILCGRGTTGQSNYQARLMEKLEKDAAAMLKRGYRIASSREYERTTLGISYYKVTYELVDPPR